MRLLCVEHKLVWGGGQVALLNAWRAWQHMRVDIQPQLVCPPNAEIAARARMLAIPTETFELGAVEKTRGVVWNVAHRLVPTARLIQTMRRSQTEVVLANGAFSFLASVFASKLLRVPIVWLEHNITLPSDTMLQRMIAWANHIVVVSAVIRTQFVQLAPAAANKISVIPNGIDTEIFRPAPNTRGETQIPRVVGTVSRLSPEKGVEYFIQAAALIARQMPDLNFLVVGDGDERAALQARARELQVHERIQFVGFRENVVQDLQSMDVVLFTSLTEAFPLAVLEAMACARPVVATAVGGVPEQIVQGETGFLVPPCDVEAMAQSVIELLRNDTKRRMFGEKGRARVIEHFSITHQATRLQAVLTMEHRPR